MKRMSLIPALIICGLLSLKVSAQVGKKGEIKPKPTPTPAPTTPKTIPAKKSRPARQTTRSTSQPRSTPTARGPRAGVVVRNQIGMELAYIPAGSFMMGSENGESNEKPVHRVVIQEGFYMGRYEVTQAQWRAVMGTTVRQQRDKKDAQQAIAGEGDEHPMYYVSWHEAREFISKLNARGDGYMYRLPSEAEWEYACRAGTTTDYAGNPDSMGWYADNSRGETHPVGQKQANAFGLYDMHGNVWEWCEDMFYYSYKGAPADGSAWLSGGDTDLRPLRGGARDRGASDIRSAYRNWAHPWDRSSIAGFRVVAIART